MTLTNIYDKIESYIRALETLEVTTDKCAAMLYPLVESALPEEVLRAWQRSGQHQPAGAAAENGADGNIGNNTDRAKDRLARLLEFSQLEVENEERIKMALQGFTAPSEPEKLRKAKCKTETVKDVTIASTLFAVKKNRLIVYFVS